MLALNRIVENALLSVPALKKKKSALLALTLCQHTQAPYLSNPYGDQGFGQPIWGRSKETDPCP